MKRLDQQNLNTGFPFIVFIAVILLVISIYNLSKTIQPNPTCYNTNTDTTIELAVNRDIRLTLLKHNIDLPKNIIFKVENVCGTHIITMLNGENYLHFVKSKISVEDSKQNMIQYLLTR